jgi:pyruvate/2-oxoglutarate/acetoin dehydrogenase E1 component
VIAARAMGDALRAALDEDDRVILLGEDLVDPYGGAFKVTRGLSTDFRAGSARRRSARGPS